jgi:NADPH2:quinone reductase
MPIERSDKNDDDISKHPASGHDPAGSVAPAPKEGLFRMSLKIVATTFGAPVSLKMVDLERPPPGPGELTIDVRAAGVNMADFLVCLGVISNATLLPAHPLGLEVAGVISAIGPETHIASGGGAVGDPVLAFRVDGGFAEKVNVRADDVFRKPESLSFPEAANLLLCGTSAAKMLRVTAVVAGDTVLVHGASGGTGVSLLQQARMLGARVIGTCSKENFDLVRRFGGEPVEYGNGLVQRVRELAPDGVQVALDCAGTDEALDVSFELVRNRRRVMTCAAFPRAFREDMEFISIGTRPVAPKRTTRADIINLAAAGKLIVPIAQTHSLAQASDVVNFVGRRHPGGGKHALIP